MQYPLETGPNFNSIIDVILMKKLTWGPDGGDYTLEDIPASEYDKAEEMHKALVEAAAENDENLMEKFFETVIGAKADYAALQAEIDEVTPQDFKAYLDGEWDWFGLARKTALQRLDDAFDKVLMEVKAAVVTDKPAIWLVYNMGLIVSLNRQEVGKGGVKCACDEFVIRKIRRPPPLQFSFPKRHLADDALHTLMHHLAEIVASHRLDQDLELARTALLRLWNPHGGLRMTPVEKSDDPAVDAHDAEVADIGREFARDAGRDRCLVDGHPVAEACLFEGDGRFALMSFRPLFRKRRARPPESRLSPTV